MVCRMKRWLLNWRFGSASVRSSAAMLWECDFILPSGRCFAPLARAPWADDPTTDATVPAHMRYLGGEFVCVPFGIGGRPEELLPEWESDSWDRTNAAPHGISSDAEWECISAGSSQVSLRLAYPADDDIEYLTRSITAVANAPALDLELTIHARRPTQIPVGLHPILRLPDFPQQLKIDSQFAFGLTYPGRVPPGASRVGVGKRFSRLDAVPGIINGFVDYSTLPKQTPTEELLMLCQVRGPVIVRYIDERALVRLSWDTGLLPSCLLWPSDRALGNAPWNHRFRGIGIEPVASVFDAASDVALERNPINSAGVATVVRIKPDNPVSIRYRLEASDL